MKAFSTLAATLLFVALPARAEYVLGRHIASIGCHAGNGTCYVVLDGGSFGAGEGCTSGGSNEFRWDDADTANGRRTYASFLAAYMGHKTVDVYIAGCSGQGFPSVSYYSVKD